MLGIALGRSEFTNGMIFYNPELDSFCVSADYLIDKQRHIGEVFPSIIYDGGLTTKLISDKKDGPTKLTIDQLVFIQCEKTYDILSGRVIMPPTWPTKTYKISLDDDNREIEVEAKNIYTEHNKPAPGMWSQTLIYFQPQWLKQGQKVMLLVDKEYKKGYLSINSKGIWEFVMRDTNGNIVNQYAI